MKVEVGGELKAFLLGKGINLNAEQQTKTKTALEYFAGNTGDLRQREKPCFGPTPASFIVTGIPGRNYL